MKILISAALLFAVFSPSKMYDQTEGGALKDTHLHVQKSSFAS